MKRTTCLLIVAVFFQLNVIGQSQFSKREVTSGENYVDKDVNLLKYTKDSSLVILFENNSFRVLTYASIFKNEMAKFLTLTKLKNFKGWYDQVLKESSKNGISDAHYLAKTDSDNQTSWALMGQVADLIEKGQCMIFSKKGNEYGTKIKVQTYNKYLKAGTMYFGDKGRRFYLNDILVSDQLGGQ